MVHIFLHKVKKTKEKCSSRPIIFLTKTCSAAYLKCEYIHIQTTSTKPKILNHNKLIR